MAEEEKILFSSEFEGEGMKKGVDETIESLVALREEQTKLKEEVKNTKTELDKTTKSIGEYEKALKKATDPAQIKKLSDGLATLKTNQVTLTQNLKQASTDLVVVSKGVQLYNKEINESVKNNRSAGEELKKFTNINALAGHAVGHLRAEVTNAAVGLVSGFAGGILAVAIPAVVKLVESLFDANEETEKMKRQNETLKSVFSSAAQSVGLEAAKLEVFRAKLNDINIPAAERVKIAKEYNKTAEETNKIDTTQINNLELINQKIDAQNKLILQRAISLAATAKLGQLATNFINAQFELDRLAEKSGKTAETFILEEAVFNSRRLQLSEEFIKQNSGRTRKQIEKDQIDLQKEISAFYKGLTKQEVSFLSNTIEARNKAKDELEEGTSLLSAMIDTKDFNKPGAGTKEIENVFAKMLAELKLKLASITEKTFQSEGIIRNKFKLQLDKDFLEIAKLLKEKRLTGPQAEILQGLIKQINDLELSKSLEEFRKNREQALNAVNDAIINLQTQNAQKRIDNIRDNLEQERQAIEQGFQTTVAALLKQSADLIKKVNDDKLLDPAIKERKKKIITLLYGGLIDQAEQAKINKELDLAFKVFQQTVNESNVQFEELLVQQDEKTAQQIRDEKTKLATGAINYEAFQKNVTKILKDQKEARDKIRKAELEVELDAINKQLDATTDKGQRDKLEESQRKVRGQIAAIDSQVPKDDEDPTKKRLDNFLKYAKAVNDVLAQVVNFWQQVNQAEERALDRSIALQEKRVENARDIADKGNAEFLEMEQKRLDELERKREENARKQLAINNALVLSQATVAAITAIAQAVQTGSPFAAFAAVAAVVGAIAAAYSFVNSLQPQQATFFEGTEYVEQGRNPSGRDTVPAKLNIGERVVTTKDNEDYWTALNAIHNHLIPPSVLNDFVNSYPNTGVPVIDFDKLSLATNGKIGADSQELLGRVDRLNNTMEEVVVGLSAIGFNVKLDEDGFSASLSTYLRKQRLRSKA